MRKMYSGMGVLVLVLVYHSQQAAGCVSCPYETDVTKCKDPFNGSYKDACENPIDAALCRKYGGGYSVYCQDGISTRSCSRESTSCNKAGSIHQAYPVALILALILQLNVYLVFTLSALHSKY